MANGRSTRSSTRQSRGSAQSLGSVSPTRGASRSPTRTVQRPTNIAVDRTYDHVLRILGFDRLTHPDHPVIQALENADYTTFSKLFTLRRADVEVLTYTDDDVHPPVQRTIPRGNQTCLLIPQGYRAYFKNNNQRDMTSYDWLLTTVDEINEYLMSDQYMYFNNSDGSSTVPGPAPGVTKPKVALETFKKSIRRDPSQFKPFSDKRYWATWHLQFVATARA